MRSKGTCKTLFKATLQSAGFTRHSALQCWAACNPRKNLRPSSSKRRCGSRDREARVELRARCASETPHSNCYANTNRNSDPKAIGDTNSNSDPNRDRNSNIYADAHGDIHSDSDSVIHSNPNRNSNVDTNADIDANSNPEPKCNSSNDGASRGLFFYRQRRPTRGPGLSQS
jgi:hypothetical protein